MMRPTLPVHSTSIIVGHEAIIAHNKERVSASPTYIIADQKVYNLHTDRLLLYFDALPDDYWIFVEGDELSVKNIEQVITLTTRLNQLGANRSSHLIAIGGGSLLDTVAFVASIYMRGIQFTLMPTTLLAMVDASIGGKTAIDSNGIKNLLGSFTSAQTVCIDAQFLQSLDNRTVMSGYGELIKHALLQDEKHWSEVVRQSYRLEQLTPTEWETIIRQAIAFKSSIVKQDPYDQGARMQLNLGHSFGHAFEAYAQNTLQTQDCSPELLHGEAVALGLIPILYLSVLKERFDRDRVFQYIELYKELFPPYIISCKKNDQLIAYMMNDKKNDTAGHVRAVLLKSIGQPTYVQLNQKDIITALDFYREVLGY